MDKTLILNAFNQLNLKAVEYGVTLMPDNIELATMKNALTGLILASPELNIITFKECTVKRYRSKIEERDMSFFVERKYDDNCEDIGISKFVFEKMDCLRMPVGQMEKANQDVIFDYMHKMIKLSDMYD